ncbi:hypothetical protein OH471_09315 [Enterococcus faecium]|uniref:hypothetical protein n=1 Tax=Enterococcus faecium TaxID=1352 RepID=UPI001F5109E2|nr:hypothetical protein [Enterococcus faecium]WHT26026.1 hypothetical protein OH471_09315 [Enterococcus faecium]
MNCLRYLGINDFNQMDRLTISEYRLRQKAHQLKMLDKEYLIHLAAWKNYEVQAQEKKGKKQVPIYQTFKSFFDYKQKEQEIIRVKEVIDSELVNLIKKANK